MLLGSVRFGQSYSDIAKILWELKSAGLPAADAMAGLQANQALVVAGAGDIAQSTRLTAGLFRTYGNEIKGATSSQEKFARIAELLATVVYESQGDMNDMVNALKYTVSTADVAGIKLDELAALIAVMNDKMLFGSKAGTSLNNAFLELAKNLDDVVTHFDLVVDRSRPLGDQLIPIVRQMQNRFKGTNMTLEEMSNLFDDFNIRGGRAWAAIITSGDRLFDILEKTRGLREQLIILNS
jgi:TP901 family phage tail tape measure protein